MITKEDDENPFSKSVKEEFSQKEKRKAINRGAVSNSGDLALDIANILSIQNPKQAYRTASSFYTGTIGSLDKESLINLKEQLGQKDVPMSVFKKNVKTSARTKIFSK